MDGRVQDNFPVHRIGRQILRQAGEGLGQCVDQKPVPPAVAFLQHAVKESHMECAELDLLPLHADPDNPGFAASQTFGPIIGLVAQLLRRLKHLIRYILADGALFGKHIGNCAFRYSCNPCNILNSSQSSYNLLFASSM
ncbi:hypothetical protein D3C75_963500 [compost metagenome]